MSLKTGKVLLTIAALLSATIVALAQRSSPTPHCTHCPPEGDGWSLFPDTLRTWPDFFNKGSAEVSEMNIGEAGVCLVFESRLDGESIFACVRYDRPTVERWLKMMPAEEVEKLDEDRLQALEGDIEGVASQYQEIVDRLKKMTMATEASSTPVVFHGKRPVLEFTSPIRVRTALEVVELRGYIEFYMKPR